MPPNHTRWMEFQDVPEGEICWYEGDWGVKMKTSSGMGLDLWWEGPMLVQPTAHVWLSVYRDAQKRVPDRDWTNRGVRPMGQSTIPRVGLNPCPDSGRVEEA